MSESEYRIALQEAIRSVRRLTAIAADIGVRAQQMHFAALDMQPIEDRSARSWEVEREEFVRRRQGNDA